MVRGYQRSNVYYIIDRQITHIARILFITDDSYRVKETRNATKSLLNNTKNKSCLHANK